MVKCPGIKGRNFIRIRVAHTASPRPAIERLLQLSSIHKKEAHAASHPTADANDPTSEMGTRMASPRSAPTTPTAPAQNTAFDGVSLTGWTYPIRGFTYPSRPKAKRRRLPARKFPLQTFRSEAKAAAKTMLVSRREWKARSNATEVANDSWMSYGQGCTKATIPITAT